MKKGDDRAGNHLAKISVLVRAKRPVPVTIVAIAVQVMLSHDFPEFASVVAINELPYGIDDGLVH